MAAILVVDDNADNRSVLITLLGYKGHRITEAVDGFEALDKVQADNPDLVITDILMPAMDGYELVRELRKIEAIEQPKVIFYSATYLEEEARALARACGVSSVISKPVEPERVFQVVDEVLAGVSSASSLAGPQNASEESVARILSRKLYGKVQEVQELNERLEQRVVERTAELDSTNRSLQQEIIDRKKAQEEATQVREERLRSKSEFLSHVSHELRSPLAVVHQFTTILLDELGGPLSAEQREYLEITLRNVNQLKHMIDELLEASRAEAGKLAIRPASILLHDLIEKAVQEHRAIAARKQISLEIAVALDLPAVHADPSRISQVLTNLLDNAIKFSPPRTSIHVHARVFEDDPQLVRVSVTDCGCGISPEDAPHVFDRLYQVKSSNEESRQGLGLGLHICKELITLHGGSIWVESKCHSGSAFHFTLPIFSIKNIVQPLILQGATTVPPSIALITVRVSTLNDKAEEPNREKALHIIRKVLERCVLPDLDVLLPVENCGSFDVFSIVARTEEPGAKIMISRIREQLFRSADPESTGITWSTNYELLDLGRLTKEMSLDGCANCIADLLQLKLHSIGAGGNVNGEQENTSHRR